MKKSSMVVVAALLLFAASAGHAQVTSTANGGAGGAGGSAAGGTATGGSSTSNTTTTGTSSAVGNTANIGAATSNVQGSEVSVNYTTPAGAAGVNGLAPGVDPANNHVVSDNNVRYSGTTKIKNTPDVSIGGPASGPCNGTSGGIGVGLAGLAVGGNISTVDKGCEARETARVAAMLGRMDVANAILENMDVVVAALNAKTDREARVAADARRQVMQAQSAAAANAAIDLAVRDSNEQAARERESVAMRAQQQAGVEALARQATMAKVNDTLSFTGKLTQGEEKTPQQLMAEELAARQSAQKQAADKQAAEAAVAEKVAAEKAAAERIAADKAAADRQAAQRHAADAAPIEPGANHAAAEPRLERSGEVAKVALRSSAPLVAVARDEGAARAIAAAPVSRKPAKDRSAETDAVRSALGLTD